MFLSVVFFGDWPTVAIDVQTCIWPVLGSYIWKGCCHLGTHPLSFIDKPALKSGEFRVGEMTHWVKHLPCKPDDLCSDP